MKKTVKEKKYTQISHTPVLCLNFHYDEKTGRPGLEMVWNEFEGHYPMGEFNSYIMIGQMIKKEDLDMAHYEILNQLGNELKESILLKEKLDSKTIEFKEREELKRLKSKYEL